MGEQSHSDYLRPGYLHHRLPVMGVVNHYRDNAITYKAQRQKCQRTEAGDPRQLLTCSRCVSDVAALDAKYTVELADAKAENDALRDDAAAGQSSVAHQSSLSVSA